MESYLNPFLTNGKPSQRPAVTAHMLHVPLERPNLHLRSVTVSEWLGFTLVRNRFCMLYVPPTGSWYYTGGIHLANFFLANSQRATGQAFAGSSATSHIGLRPAESMGA